MQVGSGRVRRVAGKKMGPSGPRALLVCVDRSASLSARGLHLDWRARVSGTRILRVTRDAASTIAEDFGALDGLRCRVPEGAFARAACRRLAGIARRARPRPSRQGARARAWRRAARRRRRPPAPAPSGSPGRALGLDLASRPWRVSRETTTRRSVSERTRSTWPLVGQVVEHLRDGRGVSRAAAASSPAGSSPRSDSSISSSNCAWLSSPPPRWVSRPRSRLRLRNTRRKATPSSRSCASRARRPAVASSRPTALGALDVRRACSSRARSDPERLGRRLRVGRAPLRHAARGLSARSSTRHGISDSTAMPSDHQ